MKIKQTSPDTYFPGRFKDKVILITGAAISNIGGCTALRAAKEGAKVVCADIKEKELNDLINEIEKLGGDAIPVIADISKPEESERMVNEAVSKYGRIDLALNAAGVMDGNDPRMPQDFDNHLNLLPSKIHNASDEYWFRVFDTNIHGIFFSMRAELKQLLKQSGGGAIVNIGSIAGIIGLPGNCAYSASKHAVIGITRNAAIDYAPYGIRINSVNMAQTDSPMVTRAYEFVKWSMEKGGGGGMAGAKTKSLLQMADENQRGSTSWEQAAIILFLLSDDASNITGANYATDGGWTAY